MKIFKLMAIALVAMLGFTACNKDCGHEFIEYDYNEALVGTWTYIAEGGLAEAMVINPDGSFTTTGIMKGGSLYEEKGTIKVVNNKVSLVFEGDGDVIEGRLELVAGKSLSIVLNEENDIRLTYDYCENDLSKEIVGMWVCNDFTNDGDVDMMIETFYDNGKSTLTGYLPLEGASEPVKNEATDYKVVGDLLIIAIPVEKVGGENPLYVANKLIYTSDGTAHGDILTMKTLPQVDGEHVEATSSWLRVKQYLNLNGKTYDYSTAYVSNAKGKDENFTIAGETFNIANITGYDFNELFGSDLFSVEFPNANIIKHKFRPNGQNVEDSTPITVDGNKVTLDMGASNPAWRTVEMYMFQDKDDTQLHMFMSTQSCINYLANFAIPALIEEGKLDPTDADAVEKVFADMEARIESINVSFVLKARK